MKNLCKEIFRKRLIVEAKYTLDIDEKNINSFIDSISKKMGMTIIIGPIVKNIAWEINSIHKGYEWIAVWAESWISVYTWNNFNFMTIDIYSCKDFNELEVIKFVKEYFVINNIEYKLV